MRKTTYIPVGEICRFENLSCENIVVNGTLRVDGAIRAKHIRGNGFIWANDISAATITAGTIDAGVIVADKLIAERVTAVKIHAAQNAAISCYLEADLVRATKITLTDANIADLVADEVVYLKAKPRSLLGTLLASFFKTLLTDLFYNPAPERTDMHTAVVSEPRPSTGEDAIAEIKALLSDMEFRRMKAMYDLTRNGSYRWQLVQVDDSAERAVNFVSRPEAEAQPLKEVAA